MHIVAKHVQVFTTAAKWTSWIASHHAAPTAWPWRLMWSTSCSMASHNQLLCQGSRRTQLKHVSSFLICPWETPAFAWKHSNTHAHWPTVMEAILPNDSSDLAPCYYQFSVNCQAKQSELGKCVYVCMWMVVLVLGVDGVGVRGGKMQEGESQWNVCRSICWV